MRFEEDSFQIILFAGNANGLFQDAMEHAEAFNFNAAQECIDKGEKELVSAQDAHREILKHLADDEMIDCNVLLAHAFDHMMAAINMKLLAEKMLRLYKAIQRLEAK